MLHGVGGNEEGLFAHADKFDPGLTVISVRAPYELRPHQYRWFDVEFTALGPAIDPAQAEQSRGTVLQFINRVRCWLKESSLLAFNLAAPHRSRSYGWCEYDKEHIG